MNRLIEKIVLLRVGDGLALGHLAHQPLAVFGEGDDRGRRPAAFGVRDDDRIAAFHDGDHRVGGPEVDTDDFRSHVDSMMSASIWRNRVGLACLRRLAEGQEQGLYRVWLPFWQEVSVASIG